MNIKNIYVGDFETNNDKNNCFVWGWGFYSLHKDKTIVGHSLDDFIVELQNLPNNSKVYFHNLKFDLEFILYWLYRNGYTYDDSKKPDLFTFSVMRDKMGQVYSATITFKEKRIRFLDSFKLIPFGVGKMSESFDIEQLKGEIDFNKQRSQGYVMTQIEKEYIINDVEIVGKSLKFFYQKSLTRMTTASNALASFKKTISTKRFDEWFPVDEVVDEGVRRTYKGGWVYVNPLKKGLEIGEGVVYDVNSHFSGVMENELLPYGDPIMFKGEPKPTELYNLYVVQFTCMFDLKEGYLPTIQLKNSMVYSSTDYISSSDGEEITMSLTSVDFELFQKHYNVHCIEYHDGYLFKSSNQIFKSYISDWYKVKEQATKDGNEGLRTIAKLMLNALYGKFGLNPVMQAKIPYYDKENDFINYVDGEEELRPPIYVAVASFITAYARSITITAGQDNYDRFLYADTDSIHLEGLEEPKNITLHPTKLGAWAKECEFTRARFVRSKAYVEEVGDFLKVTCSGLPHKLHKEIVFDDFDNKMKIKGKNRAKRVSGGIIIESTTFKMKNA